MEKYHRNEISPVEKENERDETYQADNPQIDSTRTKNNYHVVKRNGTYHEYISKRIEELSLPIKPRKDAVLMTSFVIGSDREFFSHLSKTAQEDFFSDCTMFFARRYKLENIIAAVVHLDETTPHLHLNMIPIQDGRLCAKDLFNRQNLTKLQTDFYETVGKRYGLLRGKEGSQKSHLSTAEYKAKMIVSHAQEESAGITEKAKIELKEIITAVKCAQTHFDETFKQIQTVKTERDKIVSDRNAEADYSAALNAAQNGSIAHGKNGLQKQVLALTVENTRLEEENGRLARDNKDLFERHKGIETGNANYRKAIKAISLFRSFEPEAFARVFYRATSVLQPFLAIDEPVAKIGRNRLREIEEEMQREQAENQGDNNGGNFINSR